MWLLSAARISGTGSAVKGRLRLARTVWPRQRANGLERNLARVCRVALVFGASVDDVEEGLVLTICAFCLITSAGVRMAQETSSAVEEAAA